MPRGEKTRSDIVKEDLMFALWSLESKMFGKWSKIFILDDTQNLNFNILFVDRLNVQLSVL